MLENQTPTKPCIRGCKNRTQHTPDCDQDNCPGCQPKPATNGLLCQTCTYRLTEWLSAVMPPDGWEELPANQRKEPPNSLTWAVEAINLAGERGVQGVAYDLDRVGVSNEIAAPVNLARLVLVKEIDETIKSWLNYWTTERGLRGIDHYDLAYASRYLTSWLDQICNWEPVADMWDELADLMIRSHMLAPWREERRTCPAPCPNCGTQTLVIYGGADVVTCTNCGDQLHRDEYERWTIQIADQARPKPLSFWAHDRGQTLRSLQKQAQRIGLEHDSIGRSGAKLYSASTIAKITQKSPKCDNVAPGPISDPK